MLAKFFLLIEKTQNININVQFTSTYVYLSRICAPKNAAKQNQPTFNMIGRLNFYLLAYYI